MNGTRGIDVCICRHCIPIMFFFCRFHPFLFFNRDQASMTFMGFYINESYDAIDPATGKIVWKHVISDLLCQELYVNGVNFCDDYQKW